MVFLRYACAYELLIVRFEWTFLNRQYTYAVVRRYEFAYVDVVYHYVQTRVRTRHTYKAVLLYVYDDERLNSLLRKTIYYNIRIDTVFHQYAYDNV